MITVHVLFKDRKTGRRFVQSFVAKDGHSARKVIRGIRKVVKERVLMWSIEA